jgi:hypothetical protein
MPTPLSKQDLCNELARNIERLIDLGKQLKELREVLLREGIAVVPEIRKEMNLIRKKIQLAKEEVALCIKKLEFPTTPDAFDAMCKEKGSPAVLDREYDGGIVTLTIEEEKLKDLPTLIQVYEEADNNSPASLWEGWRKLKSYAKPTTPLEAYILSYENDRTTRKSSDKILEDLDKIGLRPATLEEMMLLGIVHPEFNKRRDRYLVGLTKYQVVGVARVPFLRWNGDLREVLRYWWDGEWDGGSRFVCVRK